jgi:organic hydroperoxide reductase OsmC/OhrA
MDEVEGKGHLVVASKLDVKADVPGIDGEGFLDVGAAADAGCPISTLIRGTAAVEIAYELD